MRMTPGMIKQFLQADIQWCRKMVQYLFLATVVLIGIKFSIFVNQLASGISPTVTRRKAILKPWVYATVVCLLFIGGPLAARMTGNWQTGISNNEYLFHVRNLDMPFYQHNRGQTPAYNKKAWLRMMQKIRELGDRQSTRERSS